MAFTKFLRINVSSVEKDAISRDMILETKVVNFISENLKLTEKPILVESTLFLANVTQINENKICQKLLEEVKCSDLIDITNFSEFSKSYEN